MSVTLVLGALESIELKGHDPLIRQDLIIEAC